MLSRLNSELAYQYMTKEMYSCGECRCELVAFLAVRKQVRANGTPLICCGTASECGSISKLVEKTVGEHATVHQCTGKKY